VNYIEEAHKTLSPSFHGNQIRFDDLVETIGEVCAALAKLDSIKKTLFYGKTNLQFIPAAEFEADCNNAIAWLAANAEDEPRMQKVFHAVIGKATESGELLEALLKAVLGEAVLDEVNIAEEIGDGFWYDAILLSTIGSDFEEVQRINIEKLRARFPNKFTEADANNRDLDKEREILEQRETLFDNSTSVYKSFENNCQK